ncbi:thioredoxin family protein [Polaribacter sp.]|uniref:thioredoxin family protein n=1 Tax=Polaribacter sp. TaxID=1920175 RepID=UPI003EF5229F
MKITVISFFFSVFSIGVLFSQDSISSEELITKDYKEEVVLNWEPTFNEALKKSKNEKKPILIYFTGSDWCSPCKILDKQLFHTTKFKGIAEKDLILYEADDPRNTDLISPEKLEITYDLKRKYKVRSFPTLVFVNHKGRMIGYKKGLLITEFYYPFIESVIENY